MAAGFIEDSKASVEARNFYYKGDFRDGVGVSKRDEWAQGFLLNYESGFTQGTIGLGVDALGYAGYQLDSSPDRSGSGLLPRRASGEAADKYSQGGLAAKVRVFQNHPDLRHRTAQGARPAIQWQSAVSPDFPGYAGQLQRNRTFDGERRSV